MLNRSVYSSFEYVTEAQEELGQTRLPSYQVWLYYHLVRGSSL